MKIFLEKADLELGGPRGVIPQAAKPRCALDLGSEAETGQIFWSLLGEIINFVCRSNPIKKLSLAISHKVHVG